MSGGLTIGRLSLQLPSGLEQRAGAIARHVGHELAGLGVAHPQRIDRLALPPLTIDPQAGDRAIAGQIARAIHTELSRRQNNGGRL